MKNYKYYIIGLLSLAILGGGCHDKLLHPVPESVLTTTNAFNTASDLNLAVLGIYYRYQQRLPSDYELIEVASDNMYGYYVPSSPGVPEISILDVNSENPKINAFWKATYAGIFASNAVLANIDRPEDYAGNSKNEFIGEAKFMRALLYFDLVRVFGGVPAVTSIVTEAEARNIGRASEQEIYDLIISDLGEAVAKLPEPTETSQGRASKAAALALLGKVHIYRENWEQAKTNLEQLFNNYDYSLVANYDDLFQEATENNSETIFSIPYIAGTNGHALTVNLAPPNGIYGTITGGRRVARPTWDLRKAFEEGDTRLETTITEENLTYASDADDDPIWFPYFNKWIVPVSVSTSSGLDIPVLRLADMVLLYAEALYHLNQPERALFEINRVRARAFKNSAHNYTISDIPNEESFLDVLLLERRLELAVENNRWFDLVRTGRFTSVLTTIEGEYTSPSGGTTIPVVMNAQAYMKYFPIPYEQIQLAAPGVMKQNDQYH